MEENKVLPSSKGTWMVPKQNAVMLAGAAAPETITEERLMQRAGWAAGSTSADVVSGFL